MSFFKTYSLITFASALLIFFLLDGSEKTNSVYEIITFLIGINLFFLYPVYLVLKVLGMIWRWMTGGDKPLSGAQRAANARSQANELMGKLNSEMNKLNSDQDKEYIKKIKEELKELIQEHKTVLKSMKRVKEVFEEHRERDRRLNSPEAWAKKMKMAERRQHGNIASKVKCPHCESVGTVRRKVEKNLEESREKGIVGAVIGRKTITDKGEITKFFCDNCETSWTT